CDMVVARRVPLDSSIWVLLHQTPLQTNQVIVTGQRDADEQRFTGVFRGIWRRSRLNRCLCWHLRLWLNSLRRRKVSRRQIFLAYNLHTGGDVVDVSTFDWRLANRFSVIV